MFESTENIGRKYTKKNGNKTKILNITSIKLIWD